MAGWSTGLLVAAGIAAGSGLGRAWADDGTPPAVCARATFPSSSRVEYVNDCGFRVIFVTTCAVGAVQCYGKGLQAVEPHSRAQVELSGGPYRISQAQRAD